jgi:pimeloyl-ACP methyl ester carboxylesterase
MRLDELPNHPEGPAMAGGVRGAAWAIRPVPADSASASARRLRIAPAVAAIGVLVVLAACAALSPAPRFEQFTGAVTPEQPLLVIVPGLLATRLVEADTGRRVWPPNLFKLMLGWRTRDLALPLSPRAVADGMLAPQDVVLSRRGADYYSSFLEALTAAGYECNWQLEIGRDTNCVLFAWDWRRGFVEAASQLNDTIERIRAERHEPNLRVDLIGHSAGALVARYYAQYGGRELPAITGERTTASRSTEGKASPTVRRMVLIGPPNRGSIFAAHSFMYGYPLGVLTVQPEILATFETSYELLPPPDRDWVVDVYGRREPLDLYDLDTWRKFELSIFSPDVRRRVARRIDSPAETKRYLAALEARFARGLEDGRRFSAALSVLGPAAETEYLVLSGDCEPTLRHFLIAPASGREVLYGEPSSVAGPESGIDYEALMLAPGDGNVTLDSALNLNSAAPVHDAAQSSVTPQVDYVCERHSEMPSNERVQHDVLEFLLNPEPHITPSADPAR